jgi:hypothetical protein
MYRSMYISKHVQTIRFAKQNRIALADNGMKGKLLKKFLQNNLAFKSCQEVWYSW